MTAPALPSPAERLPRPEEDDAVHPVKARAFGFTGAFARLVPKLYLAGDLDLLAHPTLAVLGTPLERAYPSEHAALQEYIARKHLVISPFAPGTRTVPAHFLLRNRLMARLAWATVVLEANDTSGTLHQVGECLRAGSPVWLPRAVAENPATSWPARYLSKPRVYVVDHPYEVTERLEDAMDGR